MSKLSSFFLRAPGLLRSISAILSGAAVVIPAVAPSVLANPKDVFTVGGVIGLVGLIRAALRQASNQ